jgi:threonine dehydratase
MAGQGTIGLELAEDAKAMGAHIDAVLIPCSGGGLSAGIATALAALSPATKIHPVEPANYDDMARSLKAGERLANAPAPLSLCDALMVDKPGELTFPILRARNAEALAVTDDEALAAMAHAFYHLKLVAEPGGAAALAALLSKKIDAKGKTIAVILSGGNVDADTFERALNAR